MANYTAKSQYNPTGRGDLSADDYNYFQTQRRNITDQYHINRAQNTYQRGANRTDYLRNRRNVVTQWRSRVPEFQSPYVQGGLLNSGLYQQGYDEFGAARNMELGDLYSAYQQKAGSLNLADQQLYQLYRSGLSDVASAGAARRATIAEELRRAKQGL